MAIPLWMPEHGLSWQWIAVMNIDTSKRLTTWFSRWLSSLQFNCLNGLFTQNESMPKIINPVSIHCKETLNMAPKWKHPGLPDPDSRIKYAVIHFLQNESDVIKPRVDTAKTGWIYVSKDCLLPFNPIINACVIRLRFAFLIVRGLNEVTHLHFCSVIHFFTQRLFIHRHAPIQ